MTYTVCAGVRRLEYRVQRLHRNFEKNKYPRTSPTHTPSSAICETDTYRYALHTCGHQLRYLSWAYKYRSIVLYCGSIVGGNGGIRVARVVKGRFVVGGWMEAGRRTSRHYSIKSPEFNRIILS
jgi:hypothetical protein